MPIEGAIHLRSHSIPLILNSQRSAELAMVCRRGARESLGHGAGVQGVRGSNPGSGGISFIVNIHVSPSPIIISVLGVRVKAMVPIVYRTLRTISTKRTIMRKNNKAVTPPQYACVTFSEWNTIEDGAINMDAHCFVNSIDYDCNNET